MAQEPMSLPRRSFAHRSGLTATSSVVANFTERYACNDCPRHKKKLRQDLPMLDS
jgi:hypothetical protein